MDHHHPTGRFLAMIVKLKPLALVMLLSALGSRLSAQDGQVVFERTGYRLTSLGGRVSVAARVLDSRRRAVPNAPIAWRIEDSVVAVVTPRGEVQSKRVGRTRLWAVSGRDSASALILVDQWAARFAFQPAVLTFATMGESKPVQMQARDASGNAIPSVRVASACRILNPRVATMQGNGQVTANATGTTWMRCTDRGVADSLRIEVRPRAASAAIVDKAIYTTPRTVGDSFQIRMRAVDARNQPIPEARPTWASLEPRVLNIDPLSGWARGIGVGMSRVVAQLGDITDTVDVTVIAGAGMNLAPVITAGETADTVATPAGRAELQIFGAPTAVGDTTAFSIIAKEANGQLADQTQVRLRMEGDTSVARLTRDRRLAGLKEGEVVIIGTFGTLIDTLTVAIRPRGTARIAEDNDVFRRPTWGDTAAVLRANRAQVDSAMRRILAGSSVRARSGRMISGQALVSQVSHAARLSEVVVESRTGLVFGGLAKLAPFRKLQATAAFRVGTLVADQASLGEDMDLTEAEAHLAFIPTGWVAADVGATLRALSTPIARQRWNLYSASVQFRPQLIGERFRTIVGFTLIPLGSLQEAEGPENSRTLDPSYGGEAGLEFRTSFFTAAAIYHTERLNISSETGEARQDRFSMLRLRIGLQLGQ
jgi:hypothetical protein